MSRFLLTTLAAAVLVAPAAGAQYTFTEIVVPGAGATVANGINNVGQIVGIYSIRGQDIGFLYDNGTFTPFSVPGAASTYAWDVNDAGHVVGYYSVPGLPGDRGFLYSGGTFTLIDVPGAQQTLPYGINNAGQIVGFYVAGNAAHGFLYDRGGFMMLGFPFPDDLNDLDQIVGRQQLGFTGPGYAALADDGALTVLDVPGASDSHGTGINAAGQLVGYYSDPGFRATHGFLYRNGAFTVIDVPWESDTQVHGLNDDGQLVGFAVDRLTSHTVGFLATPVTVTATPEPATWTLVGTGLLVLGASARRRHRSLGHGPRMMHA